jgi:signal transduction histidine kinase/CheY-like chemotaxis protein
MAITASDELLRSENTELRARAERYREGLQRQLDLSRRLREYATQLRTQLREHPLRAPEEVLTEVAQVSAGALDVGRVSVWLVDRERGVLRCRHLFVRGVAQPPASDIPLGEVEGYVCALTAGPVAVEDAATDPRLLELRRYCSEERIGALLDVPIVSEGEVLGVICHEHLGGPRPWHDAEVDYAANLGSVVALAIEAERRFETERRLEAELAQQRKFESLGRMAASVAHDFNNVLTVISLALSRGNRGAEISAAMSYARDLVVSLMSYARREPVAVADVDVDEALAALEPVLVAAAGSDLEFEAALHAGPTRVRIAPTELQQLLVNIVTNAGEATRGHGRAVRLATAVVAREAPLGTCVEIRIADDGRGMDERTLARAFDPFFTTKPAGEGTGIGLATCQSIVARAGGAISVETKPGRGTTFRIALPVVAGEEEDVAGPVAGADGAPARDGGSHERRLLLGEDSPTLGDLISFMLTDSGYQVVLVKTVAEAREALEGERFGVVITDLRMPDGRGEDVVAAARERSERTTILVASGEAAVINGVDCMVMKPFTPDELRSAIDRAMAHRREALAGR